MTDVTYLKKDSMVTELVHHYRHNGLCRTYFKPLDKKDKRIFCMSDEHEWFICSADGEPSHLVATSALTIVD